MLNIDQDLIYRYIRPLEFNSSRPNVLQYSKYGGICLALKINYITSTIEFSYSRCPLSKLIDLSVAKLIASKRFKTNEKIVIPHDPSIPIKENVYIFLKKNKHELNDNAKNLWQAIKRIENLSKQEKQKFIKFEHNAHVQVVKSYFS